MSRNLTQKKPIIKKTVDVVGTINSLNVGESVTFRNRDAKPTTVRSTVTRLQGSSKKVFSTTEKNMVDSIIVMRTR